VEEKYSASLHRFVAAAHLASSELVITEVPVAIRRAVAKGRDVDLEDARLRADRLLDAVSLEPVDREVLLLAGTRFDPFLRSLDAIHASTALRLRSLWAFISYDERQVTAAREVGLVVVSPGVRR
jgi:predicted nucleic acid-binding protein